MIAGPRSGVGKTTVTTGLLAALRQRGVRVAAAKVGPDYIDPGYHQLAAGRPSRNLDLWMCGAEAVLEVAGRAAQGADLLVVEGVMGLFDGAADNAASSTADVAALLEAPVVLVVDVSAMSHSVAALVHGFRSFDSRVDIAGVILNRVGSAGHEVLVREALEAIGMPVFGVLRRDERFTWRDRHLGLIPVVERPGPVGAAIAALADAVAEGVDLALVQSAAARGGDVRVPIAVHPVPPPATVRIGVAGGRAFSFVYPDNLEAMSRAGAEIVPFDPLADERLPDGLAGIFVGGGFPEAYAGQLGANTRLLADVRTRIEQGMVAWAECGGLLWLARRLGGQAMAAVVATEAAMTGQLTLGYRVATARRDSPVAAAGTTLRAHEFHYSVTEPAGDALHVTGRNGPAVGGFAGERLLASYLHVHLAGQQALADRFVATCAAAVRSPYVS